MSDFEHPLVALTRGLQAGIQTGMQARQMALQTEQVQQQRKQQEWENDYKTSATALDLAAKDSLPASLRANALNNGFIPVWNKYKPMHQMDPVSEKDFGGDTKEVWDQAKKVIGDKKLDEKMKMEAITNIFGDFHAKRGQIKELQDLSLKMVAPEKSFSMEEKRDQFYQKEFDKVIQDNNPNNATSRSVIGMVGRANLAADRAMTTLMKPTVTKQEAGNVMADIASIYQSGSPTQFGMAHQEYQTLYGNVQGVLQNLTGKPQDAVPDEIKKRLQSVLEDMKSTNRLVLKKNLDATELAKRKVIQQFPQDWKHFRESIEGDMGAGGNAPQLSPEDQQAIQWAQANPNDSRSAEIMKLHGGQ